MKETKQIENHLRSWNLREPSAKVGQRLFGERRTGDDSGGVPWRWFVPAMSCLTMTLFMAGGYDPAANREAEISAAALPGVEVEMAGASNVFWLPTNLNPENTEANRLDHIDAVLSKPSAP